MAGGRRPLSAAHPLRGGAGLSDLLQPQQDRGGRQLCDEFVRHHQGVGHPGCTGPPRQPGGLLQLLPHRRLQGLGGGADLRGLRQRERFGPGEQGARPAKGAGHAQGVQRPLHLGDRPLGPGHPDRQDHRPDGGGVPERQLRQERRLQKPVAGPDQPPAGGHRPGGGLHRPDERLAGPDRQPQRPVGGQGLLRVRPRLRLFFQRGGRVRRGAHPPGPGGDDRRPGTGHPRRQEPAVRRGGQPPGQAGQGL